MTKAGYLEELDISYCSKITNNGFKSIAKCLNLKTLNIGCIDHIDDDALITILKNCKHLKSIDAHYNNRISDMSMRVMGDSLSDNLEELELANCHAITSDGISYMISRCKRLISLNISWNENINDTAMKSIATHGDSLQSLSIQQCQAITDNGLKELSTLPNLKRLDLRYCYVISESYVDELKRQRKDINIIDYPMISY